MSHTPGPWTLIPKRIEEGPTHIEETPSAVRTVDGVFICTTTSDADARLIAAAPDLLAACVQAYGDAIEGRPMNLEKLDAAIARAEGRT